MKCSEFLIRLGFEHTKIPESIKKPSAAQPVLNEILGCGDKLLSKYSTSGRFIVVQCKVSNEVREETGGFNARSSTLLRLCRQIAKVFPELQDVVILGYYINTHRTCLWRYSYTVSTNTGNLSIIPSFLQNKMCCIDMTIDKFSVFLAEWLERMKGKVIGEIE